MKCKPSNNEAKVILRISAAFDCSAINDNSTNDTAVLFTSDVRVTTGASSLTVISGNSTAGTGVSIDPD